MNRARRRRIRIVLSALLLLAGTLLSLSIERGVRDGGLRTPAAALPDHATFTVLRGRGQLRLRGTTVSDEHESALTDLIGDQFRGLKTDMRFDAGLMIPPNWETLTMRLLYLVAATESANASIDADGVRLRAVTTDAPAYRGRLDFLQSALPPGTMVDADVWIADVAPPLVELCRRNFARIATQTVNFVQSSVDLPQSSLPLLDRLIEFAYECRDRKIVISGHSDSTGSEAWNLRVSRARAQAVADYLVKRGVPAERLLVEGLGSRRPIADNDTVHGRGRNRRIEFALR